jgi:hypothetical protein
MPRGCSALFALLVQALARNAAVLRSPPPRPSRPGRSVETSGPARSLSACTGASTQLPAAQCAAWIAFYDATGGPSWELSDKPICSGDRTDPCACQGNTYIGPAGSYPVCNAAGTAVVQMCVSPPQNRCHAARHHFPLTPTHPSHFRPPQQPGVLQSHRHSPERYRGVEGHHNLRRTQQPRPPWARAGLDRQLESACAFRDRQQSDIWRGAAAAPLRDDDVLRRLRPPRRRYEHICLPVVPRSYGEMHELEWLDSCSHHRCGLRQPMLREVREARCGPVPCVDQILRCAQRRRLDELQGHADRSLLMSGIWWQPARLQHRCDGGGASVSVLRPSPPTTAPIPRSPPCLLTRMPFVYHPS